MGFGDLGVKGKGTWGQGLRTKIKMSFSTSQNIV